MKTLGLVAWKIHLRNCHLMTQRPAINHSLIVLLVTFDVLFSHPTTPDDLSERPNSSGIGLDMPARASRLNRLRRSGDQTSVDIEIVSYVTSFTNISELQTANNEFFFVESQPGECKNLKNVFHENFASLDITGGYLYVTPNLSDNLCLYVSNSTHANITAMEKTMFDMLINFRSMYFNMSFEADAFQPILDLAAQSTDVLDAPISGHFVVQRIKLNSGTACLCGWFEVERNNTTSSSLRAVNLFTYTTCDTEAAQFCKADAIHAGVSQQENSRGARGIGEYGTTLKIIFTEETLGRLIMYSSLGIGGIVLLVGLFSLACKLCDSKIERRVRREEMARLQLLYISADKRLMSSSNRLNDADLESSKRSLNETLGRKTTASSGKLLTSHGDIRTNEDREMTRRKFSRHVASPSHGVMAEALGPRNRIVVADMDTSPRIEHVEKQAKRPWPIKDMEKPAMEPSTLTGGEKPEKKSFFSRFFKKDKNKEELLVEQTANDEKRKAEEELWRKNNEPGRFVLPTTSSSSDSKEKSIRGKSKRSLDELFGKRNTDSEDVTYSSSVTDSSESESESEGTSTGMTCSDSYS